MAAKPEEQADSEEEKKPAAEEQQFEEEFDAIYYGRKRKKSESEEAAAAAEREVNRKIREDLERITADYHGHNSAQAGPLTKSEKGTRDREPVSKSISAEAGPSTKSDLCRHREAALCEFRDERERKMRLTRQEKLFQEAQEEYNASINAIFDADWDASLLTGETKSESGTRDQEPASKSISEMAAPRRQTRPRCLAA